MEVGDRSDEVKNNVAVIIGDSGPRVVLFPEKTCEYAASTFICYSANKEVSPDTDHNAHLDSIRIQPLR